MDFSLLISLIGLIFSVFVAIKAWRERRKTIYYTTRTQKILMLNSVIPNLIINYRGNKVNCLTITTFAIWANKYTKITKEECSRKHLPQITIDEPYEILYATTIQDDLDFTEGKARIDSNRRSVFLSFKSITNTNGLCVKILHTANDSQKLSFMPKMNNVKCRCVENNMQKEKSLLIYLIFGVVSFIATVLGGVNFIRKMLNGYEFSLNLSLSIGCVVYALLAFLIMFFCIKILFPVIPKFIKQNLER